MSEAKFTPGPWVIERKGVIGPQFSTDDQSNGMVKELCDISHCWENREANAHLIAAAPELYEALRALIKECDMCGHPDEPEAVEIARRALAKAQGEA